MADERSSLVKAIEAETGQPVTADPPGEAAIEPDLFAGAPVLGELMPDGRRRKGPGRPPGATNKDTKAWADFILARYSSPLIGLAEVCATPIADLAKLLGCKLLEAAEFQRKCRKDLAEYVHQKAPTQIQLNEQFAGAILVIDKTGQTTDAMGNRGLGEIIENQQLSETADGKSHEK